MTTQSLSVQIRDVARKRLSQGASSDNLHAVLLFDIEGTTTALPFVTQVLFPFAEEALGTFVDDMFSKISEGVESDDISLFRVCLAEAEEETGLQLNKSAFVCLLKKRMEENSKVSYLKRIQGVIWREAYENGTVRGHVFNDVRPFMERMNGSQWGNMEKTIGSATLTTSIGIYSSGSIAAQKLLFGHSTSGDLTPFISSYHDPSTAGLKNAPSSYVNIRKYIEDVKANKNIIIVFFTDSPAEIEASVTSHAVDVSVFVERPLNNAVSDPQREMLKTHQVCAIDSLAQFDHAMVSAFWPSHTCDSACNNETKENIVRELWKEVSMFREGEQLKLFQ